MLLACTVYDTCFIQHRLGRLAMHFPMHSCVGVLAADTGASELERKSNAACAATNHMSKEQAMEALTQVAAVRQPVKDAVYQYWLDKRKRLGKPLLRRLQPPTNPSDTNPHSCFRYTHASVSVKDYGQQVNQALNTLQPLTINTQPRLSDLSCRCAKGSTFRCWKYKMLLIQTTARNASSV